MKFTGLRLAGLVLVEPEPARDDRGYFARTFCADEFAAQGLPTSFPQCNVSFNRTRGTLRGLHWQAEPAPEGKLIRCVRGAVLDVALDLRQDSATYGQWLSMELSAENMRALYVPHGFAHGFQTLSDDAEVFYQMTERYRSDLARGVRWNDPAFGIDWPLPDPILSPRDAGFPDYDRAF
ncbi:MAG TPA: dTDP-4-dehydrorhamnose 3,5-epimerase [Oscillatoriaceae cyanobacterium]|jgi:dTDP-4-dehydrorhamnose 3,5-epimerase